MLWIRITLMRIQKRIRLITLMRIRMRTKIHQNLLTNKKFRSNAIPQCTPSTRQVPGTEEIQNRSRARSPRNRSRGRRQSQFIQTEKFIPVVKLTPLLYRQQ